MFCDEALDAIEPIAAGDLRPEGRIAAHLASCPNCAAALEQARRVDTLLRARPVPAPPPQFTARTLTRIRRERWRTDQFLDMTFNVAIGALALVVIVGVWLLLRRTGLTAVPSGASDLFTTGVAAIAGRILPSLPLYLAAAALVATALALWWWAERDATL
jgi:predicted anti-sigma-YlaC factor YlaD